MQELREEASPLRAGSQRLKVVNPLRTQSSKVDFFDVAQGNGAGAWNGLTVPLTTDD